MIETLIVTAVGAIVGAGKVFADVAPVGTALPYATYQQVGGMAVNFIDGVACDKEGARMQINVYAASRTLAKTLARQVAAAMVVSPLFGVVEGASIATYDEDTKIRGARQDFSFFS